MASAVALPEMTNEDGLDQEDVPLKATALAIAACLLWSTAFVVVKHALVYWPPFTLAGVRFIAAGLLLTPSWIFRLNSPFKDIRRGMKTIALVSLLQTVLLYGLFNYGMTIVQGALSAIIIGASPLMMAVVAHFTTGDDKLSWRMGLTLAAGFSGIVILTLERKPWTAGGGVELFGISVLVLATVISALGNLVVKRHPMDPFVLCSCQLFLGGIVLLLAGLAIEGVPPLDLPISFWLALAWMSILSALAFTIWFALLQKPQVKMSELNLWKFLIPVFGAILSWSLLPNETPTFPAVVGMVCVAGSLVVYQKLQKGSRPVAGRQK